MYLQFLVLFDKNSEIILLEKKILKLVYSGKRLINKQHGLAKSLQNYIQILQFLVVRGKNFWVDHQTLSAMQSRLSSYLPHCKMIQYQKCSPLKIHQDTKHPLWFFVLEKNNREWRWKVLQMISSLEDLRRCQTVKWSQFQIVGCAT